MYPYHIHRCQGVYRNIPSLGIVFSCPKEIHWASGHLTSVHRIKKFCRWGCKIQYIPPLYCGQVRAVYTVYYTVWMRGGVQRKGDRRGSAQFLRRLNTSPNGACNTATPKTLCTRLNVLPQELFFLDLAPQRNGKGTETQIESLSQTHSWRARYTSCQESTCLVALPAASPPPPDL